MRTHVFCTLFGLALAASSLGCPKDKSAFVGNDAGGAFPLGTATGSNAARAAASAPPLLDVCALIPVDRVAAATGIPVTASETPSGAATPECFYKTNARTPRLVIEKSLSTIAGAKQLWPGGKDMPGIGDAAYLAPKATELDVQKGSTVIRVGYEPAAAATDDQRIAVLKKLLDLALPVLVK